MSKLKTRSETWGLELRCTYCDAPAHSECKTFVSGNKTKMHSDRITVGLALARRFNDKSPERTLNCNCPVCTDVVIGICFARP